MNNNFWQFHGFNFRLFHGCFQSDLHYALEDYSAKPGVYIKYSQLQSLCLKTWVTVFSTTCLYPEAAAKGVL